MRKFLTSFPSLTSVGLVVILVKIFLSHVTEWQDVVCLLALVAGYLVRHFIRQVDQLSTNETIKPEIFRLQETLKLQKKSLDGCESNIEALTRTIDTMKSALALKTTFGKMG